MGITIFRRPSNRQPQGVVRLDPSNQLAQAPGFLWVPTRLRELVVNQPWSLGGSTPPKILGGPGGVGTLHTAGLPTVSYVDLGVPGGSTVDITQGPFTLVCVFTATATTAVACMTRDDGNTLTGYELGYMTATGGSTAGLGISKTFATTNVYRPINNSIKAGVNILVATGDGGLNPSNYRVYLNGVEGTYGTAQTGAGGTGSDSTLNLYVGRFGYSTNASHGGQIFMAGAFRRIWSPSEVSKFSLNPWQILQAAPRKLLLDLPSSGNTAALTAVSATGTPGTLSPVVTAVLTAVSGTGSPGTVAPTVTKALTGVSATGSVGTVTPAVSVGLTGVNATGSVGTVTPSFTSSLSGVTGTGSVTSPGVNVIVGLTGVTGTGSVGTVTASQSGSAALTGVTGTGSVGTVTVSIDRALTGVTGTGSPGTISPVISVNLTGVSGTGSPGTVSVGGISVNLTGVTGTGTAGQLTTTVTTALTGVTGTGSVGTVTATPTIALTGVTGTGTVNSPGVNVTVGLTGVTGTGSVGTVIASTGSTVALTGVTATGTVNSPGVNVTVGLTGVTAFGIAGNVSVFIPPPPAGPGSNGLRRWLIQQYEEYFDERERQKKLETAPAPRPSVSRPVKTRAGRPQALPQASPETEAAAAIRIASELSAGVVSLSSRLSRLESGPKWILEPLPKLARIIPRVKVSTKSEQSAYDDEEDLLLLTLLMEGT